MDNYYLAHHGAKGQKWGVRRYQNEDGTLTEAGKRRYARDTSGMTAKKKNQYVADPNKWVKEDLSRSRKLVDSTKEFSQSVKNVADRQLNKQPKRMDLSNMTDKELRDKINRELIERQYTSMFSEDQTRKGWTFVSDLSDGLITSMGVVGSALGIALAIKELKG